MFCTRCGARLDEGTAFCTSCGAPVEPVASGDLGPGPTTAVGGVSALQSEPTAVMNVGVASPSGTAPMGRVAAGGSQGTQHVSGAEASAASAAAGGLAAHKAILVAGVVIVAIAAIALAVVFLVLPAQQAQQSTQSEQTQTTQDAVESNTVENAQSSESQQSADLNMPYSYITRYGEVNNNQMPNFSFHYPNGWSIGQTNIDLASETVSLEKGDEALIYYHNAPTQTTYQVTCTSIEKVADADFVPGWVSGSDHTGLGSFMVAKVATERTYVEGSKMNVTFYALLPEKALQDRSVVSFDGGVPCFPYTHSLSFACAIPDEGFSTTTEQEVVAILASFVVDSFPDQSTSADSASSATSDDYVLADSATHEYTASELASYSDYQLFIARNEIYARHGRLFDSQELSAYFAGKSWYEGTISPSDFDDSVFNATEKKNALTIRQVEESRGSSYL